MLRVDRARVQAILAAQQPQDLYHHLQGAIELEHATIPIYLSALLSLKKGFMPGHGFDPAVRLYGRDAAYVGRVQFAERHKRNACDQ
jgi:hypothetical protein